MEPQTGNIVFHKIRKDRGPGTVLGAVHDPALDVILYKVFWQGSGETLEHLRNSLLSLAQGHQENS